jgi:4-hydroxybenzoate polyprenyltransferase
VSGAVSSRTAAEESADVFGSRRRPAVVLDVLYRSCHPLPSAAVTASATLLVAAAGNSVTRCMVAAVAVLAGQLSVGWSNDRIDAERDRRVGHEGKPLAAGAVPLGVVDVALVASLAVTVVFSLLVGWWAGLLHLGAVTVAWLYNLRLKATALSWLPYGLAFGALPAFATLARPDHPAPRPWIVVAAALLGIAVNFLNAKQSLADHPRSDVHGLPDRLGGRTSLVVGAALVATVSALVTWAPAGAPRSIAWVAAAVTALLLAVGVPALWRAADTRLPFYGLLALAPIQLLVLVVTARPLH